MPNVGGAIDRYVIEAVLGEGGMGRVYRAFDPRLGRRVALKVLLASGESEQARADAAARMIREARAAAAFNHPNVVAIYDVGETEGSPYIAMELVLGTSLRGLVGDPVTGRAQKLAWLVDVARGLGAAHRSGLVHRDIKPDNVMITTDGVVKILDFGIARRTESGAVAGGDAGSYLATLPVLTAGGVILGTLQYMAPEQLEGDPVDGRADQFSWGVMAWEMLAGGLPWSGFRSAPALAAAILSSQVRPLSEVVAGIAPAVSDAVARALSKRRDARFATMEDLIAAMEGVRSHAALPPPSQDMAFEPTAALPSASGRGSARLATREPGDRAPRQRAMLWVGAALAALGIATAGGVLSFRARSRGAAKATEASIVAPFAAANAVLACPILEVRGVPDVAIAVGAANATSLCTRAKWYLGGRDERVLVPAQLLELPTQPIDPFPDPYASPEARARTIEAARARGSAYLDGVVTFAAGAWSVDLALRTPDGRAIAQGTGHDGAAPPRALAQALDALWNGPQLPRAPLDPVVARWNGFKGLEAAMIYANLLQFSLLKDECAAMRGRASEIGGAYASLEEMCEFSGAAEPTDAGPLAVDESSGPALVVSLTAMQGIAPIPEKDRLAAKLEDMRRAEPTRIGRSMLAMQAAEIRQSLNDHDRAHADILESVRDAPLRLEAWQQLVFIARGAGTADATSALAAAWFPCEGMFHAKADTFRSDELGVRIRDARLAHLLEPQTDHMMALARALAEAGRADEVRALAIAPISGAEPDRFTQTWLLAQIDLHDAKLASALRRFEESGIEFTDLVVVSRVLGNTQATATKWSDKLPKMTSPLFHWVVSTGVAPIALCMYTSGRDRATACLDHVSSESNMTYWQGAGSDAFLRGARRYVAGDMRGAVDEWRPLVAGPTIEIVRLLPTEAFERAGEPDLAARLDARKMAFTQLAGVSEATPREAKRALARGDRESARALAQQVIDAWGVADATVPAVAEMREVARAAEADGHR